jgi:hypothetical protein
MKDDVEDGTIAELCAAVVWVPARARLRKQDKVSAARIVQGIAS